MRDVLRRIVIGGTFLLPFIPLLVTGSLFFSYITGKNFAFRIIVEIIFTAWVLLALYDKNYRLRFSWIAVALAGWVGIIFVADLFGASPAKSFWSNFERMEGWVTLAHLLLYFVVAGSVLSSEKLWKWFFNISLAAASLISVYAFAQLAGLVGIAQGGVRIDATLGNAIYMAVYMLFHTFIALLLFAKSTHTWMRVLYGILAGIFIFLLIETATRGTLLGLVGGLLAGALYIAFFLKDNSVVRKVAILGIAGVCIVSGAFYMVRNTVSVQESPTLSRIASIFSLKEALGTRLTIWGIALEGVKERPILGWGQSNFDYVFDAHYDPSLYAQEQWFDRVHNIALDWLIAGGILGFLSYLAVWVAVLWAVCCKRNSEYFSVIERALLIGLLVGYGIHNIVVFDNLISYFFFVTILIYVHVRVAKGMPRLSALRVDQRAVTQIGVPVAAVLLCLCIYYVNVPNMRAAGNIIDALSAVNAAGQSTGIVPVTYDASLLRGLAEFTQALADDSFADQEIREQLALSAQRVHLDPKASPETKSAYIALAKSELEKHITEYPDTVRMRAFLGTFYRTIGETDKALEQFTIVQTLSPNKQSILFDTGFTYIDRKEYDKAKEVLKKAFRLAPEYATARVYYTMAAIYAGDTALVAELSAPPHDALYREHDLILQAYYAVGAYERVLSLLETRIEQKPDAVNLRISKAAVQHESGNTAGAIETLEQAIGDFPEFKAQGEQFLLELRKTF